MCTGAIETPAGSVVSRYRWVICSLLFLATTINYIDRQILALIKELLDQGLGWTNEQFGMVNAAFQGAYAVGLLVFGWFVDRFGTEFGYGVSLTLWSLAAIGHAAVGPVRATLSPTTSASVAQTHLRSSLASRPPRTSPDPCAGRDIRVARRCGDARGAVEGAIWRYTTGEP
jgi:sugar phosphate permease